MPSRKVSSERLRAFITLSAKYYSWEIIMRDAGIKQASDKGDQWEITCPFHEDWSPSMRLTKSNGVYHCFSCRRKGTYTKFLWELNGKTTPYSEYCEQILKANPSMQTELHFNSIFVTEDSLDPEFEQRRVFHREVNVTDGLPITSLAQRVRAIDDTWSNLVYSMTLLQQGIAPEDVLAVMKRRNVNIKTPTERLSLMDFM